jgi:predicted DNA-binding ribbon-helix-helix protein
LALPVPAQRNTVCSHPARTLFHALPQISRYDAATVPGRWLIRGEEAVKSNVLKRSIVLAGHKTSVCLEEEFWKSVKEIAGERNMTVTELVGEIDVNRQHANLSSAIRLFVIGVYRDQIDLAKAGTRETLVKPIAVVR